MPRFGAAGYINNPARNEGEGKQWWEDALAAWKELPAGDDEEALTISGGLVTPTRATVRVDTEAAAATDDLDRLLISTHDEGSWLMVRGTDAGRVVTLKHGNGGDGGMVMLDALDLELRDPDEAVFFIREGTKWYQRLPFAGTPPLRKQRDNKGTTAAHYAVVASDHGALFTDIGATEKNFQDLPGGAAYVGMEVEFLCETAAPWGNRATAAGGETIRDGGTVSGAGGYMEAVTRGGTFRLRKVSSSAWVVLSKNGTVGAPT